jgi:tetratricopeptide (TPR) repeat protein
MGLLAELARARGDLDAGRAAEAFARLEALGDDSLSVVAHRAAAALAAGDAAAAERDARKALAAEPGRTDARILLVRALLAQQRHSEADRELTKLPVAAVLPPRLALRAARVEAAAGRDDAALRRLSDALERHPGAEALARARGDLLEHNGRLEEALAARETALALAPSSVSAQNDVAWTLALLGRDLDRALGLAQTAADRSGEAPDVLDTLATVLLARGEAAAALPVVDRALPSSRDAVRAHLLELRARALAAAGDAGTRAAVPQAE